MAAARPMQNKNGQAKQPSANPDGQAKPTVPAPSGVNPMTHPLHPLVAAPPQAQAGGIKQSQAMGMGGANPTGDPKGNIVPTPTQDVRQVRENVNFKDMNPIEQGQVAQQQGLDPYMPLQMLQQQATGAATQGASQGPVPNTLMGPFTPPGVENFPSDMSHLTTLMQQGMGPGASPTETSMGLNAHALARAKLMAAAAQGDQAAPIEHPGAPIEPPNPPMGMPGGAPGMPGAGAIPPASSGYGAPPAGAGASPMPGTLPMPGSQPPIPTPQGPMGQDQPNGGAGPGAPVPAPAPAAPTPAPAAPPAGVPPSVIANLLARHLKKQKA